MANGRDPQLDFLLGQGPGAQTILGPVPTRPVPAEKAFKERKPTLEDQYPKLAKAIREARQRGVPEAQITEFLAKLETTVKQNLPEGVSPAGVEVEVFGRRPDVVGRFLQPIAERMFLPKALQPLGPERAAQAEFIGGAPRVAGEIVGTLPLLAGATAGTGAIPFLARHPLLRDIAAGGVFGAVEPLTRGEEPTGAGVAGQAALFGGLGAVGRGLARFGKPLLTKPPGAKPPGGPSVPEGVIPIQQLWEEAAEAAAVRPETVPPHVQDILQFGLSGLQKKGKKLAEPGFKELFKAEAQPLEHLAKGEFEDIVTLNMGVNPFQAPKALKDIANAVWGQSDDHSVETLRRSYGREVGGLLGGMMGAIRLPRSLFKGSQFLERVEGLRDGFHFDQVKYLNMLDDVVAPLTRAQRNEELIPALNSQAGYTAASPAIRAVADRVRAEVLDPLFNALKTTEGVRGRGQLRYMPFYFRHILDRPATWKWVNQQVAAAEQAGDAAAVTEFKALRDAFARRGNAAFLTTGEMRRLLGANMRDFFKEVPAQEVLFGAIEARLANIPTFVKDFDLVMESYIRGALRKVHYDPALKSLAESTALLPHGHRSRASRLVRDLLGFRHPSADAWEDAARRAGIRWHDLTGRGDPEAIADMFRAESLSRATTQLEYYRTLYGNAGGALINALQTATNTFPLLAQRYGAAEAGGLITKAMHGAVTPEGRALAREMGAFRIKEAAALEGRPTLESLSAFDFFGFVESKVNRQVAGLADYYAQIARGVPHEAAIRSAQKFIRQSQFELDALGRPEALRGPLGRALGQFQTFKLSQFEFFWNTLDRRGKTTMGAVLLALGGPSAVPYLGPWLKEQLEAQGLPDVGAGIPGALGVDVARRLNPAEAVGRFLTTGQEPERGFVQSTTGPVAGLGLGLIKGMARWFMNDPLAHPREAFRAAGEEVLGELEPVALQRLAQAGETLQTGQVRAGRPLLTPALARGAGMDVSGFVPERVGGFGLQQAAEPGQQFASLLGVPTQAQRALDIQATELRRKQELNRTQRDRIIEAYLYFKRSGDAGSFRDAVRSAPGIDVRRIIREVEEPFEQRMLRRTPRRFRGE